MRHFCTTAMRARADRAASRHARDALALLGNSIRAARIAGGLRMEDIAERAGISRGRLRRIENGDPGAAIGAVFEVAAILGVPLFEVERGRLAGEIAHQKERLRLLPTAARQPRRSAPVKDDF
jgi:transcriptional regulator with XRE-family HTH domain